jgi:hypothetical protein
MVISKSKTPKTYGMAVYKDHERKR